MSTNKEAISNRLESMFGSLEAPKDGRPAERTEQHTSELSKQAIDGLQTSAGGGWSKVIWTWK